MNQPLLFFDLDGTLVDSSQDIAEAANVARQQLGWQPLPKDEIIAAVGDGVRTFVEKIICPTDSPDFSNAKDVFMRVYRDYATVSTAPYHGIDEMLGRLHKNDIAMGIISNKPTEMVKQIVQHLKWNRYFLFTYGGDAFEKAKPHALPLKMAFDVGSPMKNHRAIMIGDGNQDLMAAKNFGIPAAQRGLSTAVQNTSDK